MSFKIKENVAWVGKIGWELRRFHGEEYSTPRWMCSEQFIEFLNSPEARDIIKKHHYFSSKEDVFTWIEVVLSLSEDLIPCPRNG